MLGLKAGQRPPHGKDLPLLMNCYGEEAVELPPTRWTCERRAPLSQPRLQGSQG